MMLTYCFKSRITSGYVKGTKSKSAKIKRLLQHLTACARPAVHPLLMPILLIHELSAKNDEEQRAAREIIRQLESALSQRYQKNAAMDYGPKGEIDLDSLNQQLTDCQCKVLQKNPQAWGSALEGVEKATHAFWEALQDYCQDDEPDLPLQALHRCLLTRLDFIARKLNGIENYAHVSLERLKSQREVVSAYFSLDAHATVLSSTSCLFKKS
jgi:hypothetical protein